MLFGRCGLRLLGWHSGSGFCVDQAHACICAGSVAGFECLAIAGRAKA